MDTEIYYFSGTGNSLYVARELQKRLPDVKLIPIISLLHMGSIQTKGKSVGIVFPVHAITIPVAVKKFLRKINLDSADYVFAVATRGGTIFRGFEVMDRMLVRKGKKLDAHFILNMYMNDPREEGFGTPAAEDIQKLEAAILQKLDMIQEIILNGRASREKDTEYLTAFPYNPLFNNLMERLVMLGMTVSEYIGGVNYFCTDERCTGCGICERVCLSRKIRLEDKKPLWQKNVFCYMCFACINYCPVHAVQINDIPVVKSHTRENGRYTHPYGTIEDICGQKELP